MSLGPLRPDCSTINLAETSNEPKKWLLHPTGITYKFDAKLKTLKRKISIAVAYPTKLKKSLNWWFTHLI